MESSDEADEVTMEQMRQWVRSQMQNNEDPLDQVEVSEDGWEDVARRFGVAYVVIGVCAIIVNAFIVGCLLKRRRTIFSHVFYVVIFNFSLIDTVKGICSILFALKLLKSNMSYDASTWTVHVDQYSGVLLRFTNLATILNVSMITMNEFIFICYPLRYSAIVTRRRVLLTIIASWVLSWTLTLTNALANQQHTYMIDTECLGELDSWVRSNGTGCLHQLQTSSSHHVVFHLGLIVFCVVCLAFTASCYVILFRMISAIVRTDAKMQAEMDSLKDDSSNSHRKQIVRRHKYVVIIGSVIVIYSAYLSAYAIVQGLQLVNISRNDLSTNARAGFVYTKYVCYLFVAFHSLLQPICFLRMREFRNVIRRTVCAGFRRESLLSNDLITCKRQSCQPTDI